MTEENTENETPTNEEGATEEVVEEENVNAREKLDEIIDSAKEIEEK